MAPKKHKRSQMRKGIRTKVRGSNKSLVRRRMREARRFKRRGGLIGL